MTSQLKPYTSRRRLQSGQAAVEGALVSIVFLVLVLGLMDFGRMVWTYTMISHGAREATRYAMVHGSSSPKTATVAQIQDVVTSMSPGVNAANVTTTVTFTPDQSPGSTVKVAVAYEFYPIAPFIPVGPLQMSSTSQMVIYQ